MKQFRPLRYLAILALFPAFALLFWMTALVTSNIASLLIVGVNVHGLSLTSYSGDSAQRAPLSLRMFQDAQQDSRGALASPAPATPSPIASGPVTPTPSQNASPKPAPSPKPTPLPVPAPTPLPLPTPTLLPLPTPSPTATPTPSLLPSLLPLPLPTLPLPTVPPGL